MLEPRIGLRDATLEPAHRRLLVLRRSPLRVEMDELDQILKREVREFASGVFSQPQCSSLDCSLEPDVSVGLRGQERMFALTGAACWLYSPAEPDVVPDGAAPGSSPYLGAFFV